MVEVGRFKAKKILLQFCLDLISALRVKHNFSNPNLGSPAPYQLSKFTLVMLQSSHSGFLIKHLFFKCQGQITRAQEQEEIYGLKRDLVVLRRRDDATTRALLEANRRIEELKMFKVFNLCDFYQVYCEIRTC